MVPTLTGLIVILVGIWCLFGGYQRTLVTMMLMTLFEAADAADLPVLGGASITPAKLFLVFFVLRIVSMRFGTAAMLGEIAPRRVLFIYLLLVFWVVTSSLLMPRLFAGMTDVFSLARSDSDDGTASPVPLQPSGGNITQSVYALGSFVIAIGMSVLARRPGGYATVLTGLLLVTGLDIFFAIFDLATAATHTEFLLDVIHTGAYAFLTSDESGGLKRISGSFTEALTFATFSLTLLAVNVSLFLSRVRPRLTGFYAVVLAVLLFLSTSSTAYVGLAILAAAFGVGAVYTVLRWGNARPLKTLAAAGCIGVFIGGLAFLFAPSLTLGVWNLLDVSLFQKSESESALERGALNTQAIQIFRDTYGLGAGVGSTRTSNYVLLLASNLGIIGMVLFVVLVLALAFLRVRSDLPDEERAVVRAARVGLLAALVPATLIGTIFDLGPLFYIFVGVVASSAPRMAAHETPRAPAGAASPSLGSSCQPRLT